MFCNNISKRLQNSSIKNTKKSNQSQLNSQLTLILAYKTIVDEMLENSQKSKSINSFIRLE